MNSVPKTLIVFSIVSWFIAPFLKTFTSKMYTTGKKVLVIKNLNFFFLFNLTEILLNFLLNVQTKIEEKYKNEMFSNLTFYF